MSIVPKTLLRYVLLRRTSIIASMFSLLALSHAVCAAMTSSLVTTPSRKPTVAVRRFSSALSRLASVVW